MRSDRWLLPEGVEEIPPAQAWWIEQKRAELLSLFRSWGYELVMPPMLEYLESLLTGSGQDLALQTFTVTDQYTGRLMGVRADMTPQVARIDAHFLRSEGATRLCYAGPVLRTRIKSAGGTREPLQFGAELFGEPGPDSDCEIVRLMVESAALTGLHDAQLDLGHVGIFRALIKAIDVSDDVEGDIFDALIRKSASDVEQVTSDAGIDSGFSSALCKLVDLSGGHDVLIEAKQALALCPEALVSLENLIQVGELCRRFCPDTQINFDLAELRGYRYHTGVVFALYAPGHGQAVAQGGRYDDIGKEFGRRRPATGFSADIREIMRIRRARGAFSDAPDDDAETNPNSSRVLAPFDPDPKLAQKVKQLRDSGLVVIQAFNNELSQAQTSANNVDSITAKLEKIDGDWQLVTL